MGRDFLNSFLTNADTKNKCSIGYNVLYMKSGGSYSIVRSVHRDSVTSFNVSCENGDHHFLYTLLGADSFKLAFNTKKQ